MKIGFNWELIIQVTFTNLSQGDYELKIIGSNNDGVWNDSGKSLFIYVSPPWWKTKIAFGFYALAFYRITLRCSKI